MRNILPAAMLLALAASAPAAQAAPVRLCGFPHSASEAVDNEVARAVFQRAGLDYARVDLGDAIGRRGASAAVVGQLLQSRCDVFIGVPVASHFDKLKPASVMATPYLDAAFVKFHVPGASVAAGGRDTVAVAYKSPAQIIAAEEHDAQFDVLNSTTDVMDAVAQGKDAYGIAWYPSLVTYQQQHPQVHFAAHATHTAVSQWQLSFVTDTHHAALARRIASAVHSLEHDGSLPRLTSAWQLQAEALRPADAVGARTRAAVFHPDDAGTLLRTSDAAPGGAKANFAQAQVEPGKKLYAADCARCHGDNMEGRTAPALRGEAFAPSSGSTMTIGGIYQYMTTNMPADKPGMLKPKEYADIMAYMLQANGYAPSGQALDPAHAGDDQTAFNSYVK